VTGNFSETYDPTIESVHHKTIRFRKVHFATDIVDTAGMVRIHMLYIIAMYVCMYVSTSWMFVRTFRYLCRHFNCACGWFGLV
jgi:hypothetical protein